jgi:hypothetical protein
MAPARRAARQGPWKLEIQNWKLDKAFNFQFPVSYFRGSTVIENGQKKKNLRTIPASY